MKLNEALKWADENCAGETKSGRAFSILSNYVRLYQEKIKELGDRAEICTYDILGEVCGNCCCKRTNSGKNMKFKNAGLRTEEDFKDAIINMLDGFVYYLCGAKLYFDITQLKNNKSPFFCGDDSSNLCQMESSFRHYQDWEIEIDERDELIEKLKTHNVLCWLYGGENVTRMIVKYEDSYFFDGTGTAYTDCIEVKPEELMQEKV